MPRPAKPKTGTPAPRARRPSQRARRTPPTGDVALVVGKTADMRGYHIMRRRSEDHPVELGTVMPLREGQPIDGEVLSFHARKDQPLLHDVKVEFTPEKASGEDPGGLPAGPAQVASEEYRRGWDLIWGGGDRANRPARLN